MSLLMETINIYQAGIVFVLLAVSIVFEKRKNGTAITLLSIISMILNMFIEYTVVEERNFYQMLIFIATMLISAIIIMVLTEPELIKPVSIKNICNNMAIPFTLVSMIPVTATMSPLVWIFADSMNTHQKEKEKKHGYIFWELYAYMHAVITYYAVTWILRRSGTT